MTITVLVLVVLEVPLGISFARSERRRLETDVQHDAFGARDPLGGGARDQAADGVVRPPAARRSLRGRNRRPRRHRRCRGWSRRRLRPARRRHGPGAAQLRQPARDRQGAAGAGEHGLEALGPLGTDLLYVAVPVAVGGEVHGAVRVTYPLSVVSDRVRRNWLLLAGIGGVVLAVVFLVSLWLARSVTRPLADLERAAARLGAGDLAARVPVPSGPAEVRLLAEEFNATAVAARGARRLAAGFRCRCLAPAADAARRSAVAPREPRRRGRPAGHRGSRRRTCRGAASHATRRRAHDPRSGRASRVSSGGHRRQRGDGGTARRLGRVRGRARRSDRTAGRIRAACPRAHRDGSSRSSTTCSTTRSTWHRREPRSCSAGGGTAAQVEVRVADAGPGMTDEQRARAFDRFWRSRSTQSENGGFGLGLSIVRRLVTADGGDVELLTSASGGLEVVVRLRAGD